jgi:transcriptional regulator with XRE-family HTH domain
MREADLRQGREAARLTQMEAAGKLGVSQPYLSLLEKGDRKVSAKLARKAVTLYRLSPVVLRFTIKVTAAKPPAVPAQTMAEELSALGYPGFSHVRSRRKRNPAEVLFSALAQEDLESRLSEALPWVVLQYTDLDWNWLVSAAKQHDLQNRLGFVTTFAVRVAERQGDLSKAAVLKRYESLLEHARLAKEDTFCHESLSKAEREWLAQERSEDARHWNVLTDLRPEQVKYAAA